MYLKRFRGPTVRDALAQARAELGPDAIVLSSGLASAAGVRGWMGAREVEIVAAAEREVSEGRTSRQETRHPTAPRGSDGVMARLSAAGFAPGVATAVLAALPAAARRDPSPDAMRTAVAAAFGDHARGEEPLAAIEVFVGPPGAGKTTTIAKLAAQHRARGAQRVGLVAADGFRVGAIEQLKQYAEIIGAPFHVARNAGELDAVLHACATPVLVDTAGRSPRDAAARDLFAVLARRPGVRTHLVVPAATRPRDLARALAAHDAMPLDRVVFTKVDESESMTEIAGLIRERGLRVSYLGTGQRVPEDLRPASPQVLATAVLGEASLVETAA